ncbi:cytochrome P450 [Crossiella equi]|uniref:Cytochrome P450 n=1 Tax=Crossiella equi TaxID=130796 RepID=A0ABS5A7D5_9PSEU|nr:cytochrome P450 [Crossiella equi]MBP2471610.1 cytochrome P450 [Crossiella equi]
MTTTEHRAPSALSAVDSARVFASVLLPVIARGAIRRRPRWVALAQRLDTDRRAVRLLTELRERYGDRPLRVRVPFRELLIPLDSADANEALAHTPSPFSPATLEKRHALGQFQPHGLLISPVTDRPERRTFTEHVLDTANPVHQQGPDFATAARSAVGPLLAERELDWEGFSAAWWRLVRQVVLGRGAAEDTLLTNRLFALRDAGNWSWLHRKQRRHREVFLRHLGAAIDRAEPGSLAARIVAAEPDGEVHPADQVAHWLFAFDAAAIATFRALALLATHPEQELKALAEAEGAPEGSYWELPYLRACVLESLRLWPTTPLLLREATEDTTLAGCRVREGATVVLFAPYLHRAPARFDPEIWLNGTADFHGALVPFSGGPAVCPGRNLVLLLTTQVLAALRRRHDFGLLSQADLLPDEPPPSVLDHFALRFSVTARR